MDEDRRIRFLVSPLIFFASILWGAWWDQNWHSWLLGQTNLNWPSVVGLITAGSAILVFAIGYIIGTVSYFCLRLVFLIKASIFGGSQFHEVALSDNALMEVREWLGAPKLNVPDDLFRQQELFAGAAFDYNILRKKYRGVHQWLFRRWNAFSIATTSFFGLILSFPFGYAIGIRCAPIWWVPVGIFGIILLCVMFWAWNDAMNMLEFMVTLREKQPRQFLDT